MEELTDSIIDSLKVKFSAVFFIELEDKPIIFRALTFSEYDIITSHLENGSWSSAEVEEACALKAVVWPEDFSLETFDRPGSVSSLAEEVIFESGFTDVAYSREIVFQSRNEMANLRGHMMSLVLLAMPSYKYEELCALTFKELADRVALAENVIYFSQVTQGLQIQEKFTLNIRTPEEIEEELNQKLDKGSATKGDPIAQKLQQAMG